MDNVFMTVCAVSAIFSLFAFYFSLVSYIETQSFKKSTHSVQYVGATADQIKVSDNLEETPSIDKLNKEYSEDVEEVMPFFSPSDDDKKLRSL